MISNNSLSIPYDNPEVYLNLLRVIGAKEFGSVRPIAFRSSEGTSNVASVDKEAYTTTDAFINALTDVYYSGEEFDGIITATLTNKSEYSLQDLVFSGPIHVEGTDHILSVYSKCDFVVYFRWGKGFYTAQENANFLASKISSLEMKGVVPFASNHNIVNNMTFSEQDGNYIVMLDTKDNTVLEDVLKKFKENINSIKIV